MQPGYGNHEVANYHKQHWLSGLTFDHRMQNSGSEVAYLQLCLPSAHRSKGPLFDSICLTSSIDAIHVKNGSLLPKLSTWSTTLCGGNTDAAPLLPLI